MSPQIFILVTLSLLAFSGNALFTRLALVDTGMDPASFVFIRFVSAAVVLMLIVRLKNRSWKVEGNWRSAGALLLYGFPFTFAFVNLSAATGALLAFGAVQVTMILTGLWRGERFSPIEWGGLFMALAGVLILLLPGVTAPPLFDAIMMIAAGTGWGIYSLLGRGQSNAMAHTAGNFLRALPVFVIGSLLFINQWHLAAAGIVYALLSGILTSALGYYLWYKVLPKLSATRAAVIQISVPVVTALLAIPLLDESLHLRLIVSSVIVLGGLAIVVLYGQKKTEP